jgi:hypothetical protein
MSRGESLGQGKKKRYVWHSLGGDAGAREEEEFYPDLPRKEVVAQFGPAAAARAGDRFAPPAPPAPI